MTYESRECVGNSMTLALCTADLTCSVCSAYGLAVAGTIIITRKDALSCPKEVQMQVQQYISHLYHFIC